MPGDQPVGRRRHVSRRAFLGSTVLLGSAGAAAAACSTDDGGVAEYHGDISAPDRSPPAPTQTPVLGVYQFFTAAEARTVEAVAERIMPGDEDDPGVVEAGVVTFIDNRLAGFEAFAEPTYRGAPFAEPYEGDGPPGPDTEEVIHVQQGQLHRYGSQGEMPPQQIYRDGLERLDAYCGQRFGSRFIDLDDDQRDQILLVLDGVNLRNQDPDALQEQGMGPGQGPGGVASEDMDEAKEVFGDVNPGAFFGTVREDTIDGMFGDPLYGGNRGLVGWLLIGYPGVQRSYSPREMKQGTSKVPQSLDGLHPMSPDRPDEHAPPALERPREGVVEG